MDAITEFKGKYRFLSNFYPCVITDGDVFYPTVEHAFQAAKTLDVTEQTQIRLAASPGEAKRLGRAAALRTDWDKHKLDVMLFLVRQKFIEPNLKRLLLDTGDAQLVEGNYWNDTFWGVCRGKGMNHLGIILMQVRDEVK